MDKKPNHDLKPGVYVIGKVLSTTATVHPRKDGSGQFVRVRHEMSTRPGVIDYEQLLDPAKDAGVKVEGGQVTVFPTLPEDEVITLRVEPGAIGEYKGKVRISRAERIG
jgi:hypothetical protein